MDNKDLNKLNWKNHLAYGIAVSGILAPGIMGVSVIISWLNKHLDTNTAILMLLFLASVGIILGYLAVRINNAANQTINNN